MKEADPKKKEKNLMQGRSLFQLKGGKVQKKRREICYERKKK